MCAIQDVLMFTNKYHLIPIVVFGDKCELEISGYTEQICTYDMLLSRIDDVQKEVFTHSQILSFAKTINELNIKDKATRAYHNDNVQCTIRNQ
jgi:hypothetical protein